jgi:hypothetical protein
VEVIRFLERLTQFLPKMAAKSAFRNLEVKVTPVILSCDMAFVENFGMREPFEVSVFGLNDSFSNGGGVRVKCSIVGV